MPNHLMTSLDWGTNTLETLSHQPQELISFTTQPAIGEPYFPTPDNDQSFSAFPDCTLIQDLYNGHGEIIQESGPQPLMGSSSSALGNDQFQNFSGCSCMACLLIGVPGDWNEGLCCRFKGCNFTTDIHAEYVSHERDHYHEPGNPLFHCVEQHCKFATKRWPDLIRHCTVRHCTKPKQFSCPVPWCKYSGDNGFARKDRLRSHQRNVHQGFVTSIPSSTLRPIQPAMPGSRAFAN